MAAATGEGPVLNSSSERDIRVVAGECSICSTADGGGDANEGRGDFLETKGAAADAVAAAAATGATSRWPAEIGAVAWTSVAGAASIATSASGICRGGKGATSVCDGFGALGVARR